MAAAAAAAAAPRGWPEKRPTCPFASHINTIEFPNKGSSSIAHCGC